MAKGYKTGGRKAGTPNKLKIIRLGKVRAALEEGASPLDVQLAIMQHHFARWRHPPKGQTPAETAKAAELALEAAKSAAPFVHARLQSIEHKGEVSTPTEMTKLEFLRRVYFLAREARELEARKQAITIEPEKLN
jgi:hypothetical protein